MADNENNLTPEEIQELRDQFDKIGKQLGITSREFKTAGDRTKYWAQEVQKAENQLKQTFGKQMGSIVAGVGKSFAAAGRTAMQTGDAIQSAGVMMTAQMDAFNNTMQHGATAVTDYGKALAASGNKAGEKIAMMGEIAGVAGNAIAEMTKMGIQFMQSQTTKLIDGFKTMSAVGAVYSGGMKEMTDTALEGGLTLEQFSKAVTENRDKLNSLGLGMGEASKRMAGAMNAGGAEAKKAMFALGFGAEEQAAAYATVMKQMAGPNQRLTSSNTEVAAQTMKYVENLKVLQELTGEDIKSKQETIRQENDNLAFQQKLAEMSPKQQADLQAAMENMTEGQRRALRENMIYGAVISKDLAIAQSTNSGIQNANQDFFKAVQEGSLDAKRARDIQGANADDVARGAKENTGLAMGMSDEARGAAKANLEYWQYTAKFGKEAQAAAEKANADAKKNTGKGSAADLMATQQDFAVEMQKIASEHLPEFAKALSTTIDQIKGAVGVMAGGGSSLASMMSGWGGIIASVVGTVVTSVLTSKAMGMAGGGVGGAVGGAAGKMLGGVAGGAEGALGGLGKGAGAGVGGFMQGIGAGAKALADPLAAAGIAVFTLAMMGLGKALQWAAPAFKAIGEAVSTIVKGVAESLVMLSKEADPMNLLKLAPGIAAVGFALIPFGVGGALAGLVSGTGGLTAIANDLKTFEELDPNKLMAVADSIGKLKDNLPSALDLAKMAAVGVLEKTGLVGGSSSTASSASAGTGGTGMEQLVALSKEQLKNQKEMLAYLRDNVDASKKIHTALM